MKELDKLNRFPRRAGVSLPRVPQNAAHFAFLDCLFGTAVRSDRAWPAHHGVVGDCVPNGFVEQLAFPFRWKA